MFINQQVCTRRWSPCARGRKSATSQPHQQPPSAADAGPGGWGMWKWSFHLNHFIKKRTTRNTHTHTHKKESWISFDVKDHFEPVPDSRSLVKALSALLFLRWWILCVSTWTRFWSVIRSCRSWTTGLTPCRLEPLSLRLALQNWRINTGGRMPRWGHAGTLTQSECKVDV